MGEKRNQNITSFSFSEDAQDTLDKIFGHKQKDNHPGKTYNAKNPETGEREWVNWETFCKWENFQHRHRRADVLCDFVTDDITGQPLHIKGKRHLNRVLKEHGLMERPPEGHRIRGAKLAQGA